MKLEVSTRKVTRVLVLAVLCLTLASLFSQFYGYLPGQGLLQRITSPSDTGGSGTIVLFDLYEEANVPTWYSSITLLLCSVLLAIIAAAEKRSGGRYVLRWGALSIIFLLLSMDEVAQIHDKVDSAMDRFFDLGGFLTYAWVIPAAAFVLVLALAYLKFFLDLPARTRWLFLVAGTLYVGGALVMEMIAGYYEDSHGISDTTSGTPLATTVASMLAIGEELLEMGGVVVFVYALMLYISTHFKDLHVLIKDE